MMFSPDLSTTEPVLGYRLQSPPSRWSLIFAKPPEVEDQVRLAREQDRLLLFRERVVSADGIAVGTSLFVGSMISAAHAPRRMRFLFDRSVHLGPALFPGGGMGAGVGGYLP